MKNQTLFKAVFPLFLLLIAGVLYSLAVTTGKGYKTSLETVSEAILDDSHLVYYFDLLEAWNNKSTEMVIVDLRAGEVYEKGHLPGALSLPLHTLFDRPAIRQLNRYRNQDIVLYCDSQNASTLAFMMLTSLGYDNVRVLAGGHEVFVNHIQDHADHAYLFYTPERARWNYGMLFRTDQPATARPATLPAAAIPDGGC